VRHRRSACPWHDWRGTARPLPARGVDEPGYLPFEPYAAHLFFQLVSRRYESGAMLVTSNRVVGEWGSVFGDPVVATGIFDRLLHSHVITIRGDSYRLHEKRRSGLWQNATATPQQPPERQSAWGSVLHDEKGSVSMSLDTNDNRGTAAAQ
jgi:hypothetical protein